MSAAVRPIRSKLVASREGIGDILADLQLGFDGARKYGSSATASGDPQALAAF
jgi:O-acetylhomoserine (thiol)-lyase